MNGRGEIFLEERGKASREGEERKSYTFQQQEN